MQGALVFQRELLAEKGKEMEPKKGPVGNPRRLVQTISLQWMINEKA